MKSKFYIFVLATIMGFYTSGCTNNTMDNQTETTKITVNEVGTEIITEEQSEIVTETATEINTKETVKVESVTKVIEDNIQEKTVDKSYQVVGDYDKFYRELQRNPFEFYEKGYTLELTVFDQAEINYDKSDWLNPDRTVTCAYDENFNKYVLWHIDEDEQKTITMGLVKGDKIKCNAIFSNRDWGINYSDVNFRVDDYGVELLN